jgi:hypothetical protein
MRSSSVADSIEPDAAGRFLSLLPFLTLLLFLAFPLAGAVFCFRLFVVDAAVGSETSFEVVPIIMSLYLNLQLSSNLFCWFIAVVVWPRKLFNQKFAVYGG